MLLIGSFYCLFTFVVSRLFKQRGWPRNRDLPILLAIQSDSLVCVGHFDRLQLEKDNASMVTRVLRISAARDQGRSDIGYQIWEASDG